MNIDQPSTNINLPTSNADSAAKRQSLLDKEITLFDLLFIMVKHWKKIIGVPLVATVITAIITLFMPNIYTAKTLILPGDDDSGGMMGAMMAQMGGLAGLAGGLVGSTTKADLYVTMLKSETIRDPIIDRFKLMEVYKAKFRFDVYNMLSKRAVISSGKKDGVITIEVDDKDPKRAAKMANAYVEELGKMAAGLNMSGAGDNRAFLEKRIAEAHADLDRAEDALKVFQTKNKAISVPDQVKATIEGVAQLRAQLATQEVQLATLQRQFTDSSQEVKTLKSTISNLRTQIAKLEGTGGGSSSIPSIGSVPKLGQEYLRLMRDFKIQEAVLEMLTKQYEVSKLSEVKDVSTFKVLQLAKAPELKSKPKRSQICIIVALVTGLLMLMVAYLLELSERAFPEDRESMEKIHKLLPNLTGVIARLRNILLRRGTPSC